MTKSAKSTDGKPHRVVALVYNGLCSFEFGIVAEVFGLSRPEIAGDWYQFKSVSLESGPLFSSGGLGFATSGTQEDLANAQTIIIPGWRGKDEEVPQIIINALKVAHERGCRIISICSGIYVLAVAGLLVGKKVTTHWRYVDDFRQKYPDIDVAIDHLYVDEGDIMSSAGSSAGIDLCLHIVRKDYGAKIANSVARRLVMHAHRQGGQTQFIEQPLPEENEGHRLSATLDYIRKRLGDQHSISSLAQNSGMSARTFQRRFIALTGMPVGRWINQERLNRACSLLETTTASVDDIANTVGASSTENLRYHFRKGLGVSPGQYRNRFLATG